MSTEAILVDAHSHLAPGPDAVSRLLASMDALGIVRSVVVGGGLLPPRQLNLQIASQPSRAQTEGLNCDNGALRAECERAGGRLVPFYFANPWNGPAEYQEVGAEFFGLKLGPAVHGVSLLADETHRLIDVASKFCHPVYLHCLDRSGFRVSDLVRLAELHPEVRFILGHGGVGQLDFEGVDLIAPMSTISYETSGAYKMVVKYALDRLGARRVIFGSEYPLQSARAELAKIQDLNLTNEELLRVSGQNMLELLSVDRRRAAC